MSISECIFLSDKYTGYSLGTQRADKFLIVCSIISSKGFQKRKETSLIPDPCLSPSLFIRSRFFLLAHLFFFSSLSVCPQQHILFMIQVKFSRFSNVISDALSEFNYSVSALSDSKSGYSHSYITIIPYREDTALLRP